MFRKAIATLVATFILFTWGGISQTFPWGSGTSIVITTATNPNPEDYILRDPIVAKPSSIGTLAFDQAYSGRVGMLFTDQTVSWVSSKPIEYYDATAYLLRQIVTQAIVATFIVALLVILCPMDTWRSITIVSIGATAASVATYGALANWWGLAPIYAVGESVNLIIGWLLAAIPANFILRRNTKFAPLENVHGS